MDSQERKYHYFFIHNVIGDFFHATLDYFGPYLYERFKYRVVGTYDKAVEYLNKKEQYDRETDLPQIPALIMDPSGEMVTADAIAGGKQLWRYPNLAAGMVKRLFSPVYQDSDVMVNVGFTRLKGTFNLLMLTNSFYEYCDLRLYMIQVMGDMERYIYPIWFNSFIILPERFINYEYINPETGKSHKLNWESAGAYDHLVKTTNKDELVIPVHIKPIYKMTGLNDGSTKYGGTDKLADWRLNVEIEYEVEIPSFLILETDLLITSVKTNFGVGAATSYSENARFNNMMEKMTEAEQEEFLNYIIDKHGENYLLSQVRSDLIKDDKVKHMLPHEIREAYFEIDPEKKSKTQLEFESHETIIKSNKSWDIGLDETSSGEIHITGAIKECQKRELKFKTRYAHIVTKAEAEAQDVFYINIPEKVTKERLVLLSKTGHLIYGTQYSLNDDGDVIAIYVDNIDLRENDLLELYIYDYQLPRPQGHEACN